MGVRVACLSPDDDHLPHLDIKTVGPKFCGKVVLTCDAAYECYTHFIGGRTLPCLEDGCAGCKAHRPARYEAFLSGCWFHNRKHEIFRMSEGGMRQLKARCVGETSLRGIAFEITRKGSRDNGRLEVVRLPEKLEIARLPFAPELELHLSRVWRIDGIEVLADERGYVAQLEVWQEEAKRIHEAGQGVDDDAA